ncbi:MAG: [NiFe] hydrogenase metallocenter assembly protein HypF [Ignavibacteriae bacterium]|nr:MAG: [NiFe] hydrogenase metallocenter assembly protein HypF [Ignavibacteriota bacterium]
MISRVNISIRGAVQGVGFRPFIYRLAKEIGLKGFVFNSSKGVFIEAEGDRCKLEEFILRIEKEKPPRSFINSLEFSFLEPSGYEEFSIRESDSDEEKSAIILPDIAVCNDCLNELFDVNDRRYLYPFINCTNCGTRFSIIESLPYDRPNTSMKNFQMCDKCKSEYENPEDRRFHAQPIACPVCGPHLELWDAEGKLLEKYNSSLEVAADLILKGKIIALKGLGGFQLIVDATNDLALNELRRRKIREEKPFALMFSDVQRVMEVCDVSDFEKRALLSPEAPIVLLKRKSGENDIISNLVAPNNPYFGIMLPYTPLHHLLMKLVNKPIVATSGNLSEEPMCIDEREALLRLKGIADYFLVHNRPIVRHVDDSIVRIVKNREMVLRRARGYAPLPISIENEFDENKNTFIAVGAHLKNTIALTNSKNIFISQHIGDLSTQESYNAFTRITQDFLQLYPSENPVYVSDLHPDYLSTKYSQNSGFHSIRIQHHKAHIAACYAENKLEGEVLGVAWDGTGYGEDGKIWGGEFFVTDLKKFERVASFREFPLPGGEIAIREPRRAVMGMLYEINGEKVFDIYREFINEKFSDKEIRLIKNMLINKINSPLTTSAGRIFDAVASILNIRDVSAFEGQAAMMLEYAAIEGNTSDYYEISIKEESLYIIDWKKMIEELIFDSTKKPKEIIARKFHNTMAKIIKKVAEIKDLKKIVLSGGCFQNVLLLEETIKLLETDGRRVFWHQRIPPNDGGIALGQAYLALKNYNKEL